MARSKFDPSQPISAKNAIVSEEDLFTYQIHTHLVSTCGEEFANDNPYTPEVVNRINAETRRRIEKRCAEQGITVEEYRAQIP